MAKQKGVLKLKGTIGDLTFYKSQDGYIAKEKSVISAERIANDPAFVRTRENGAEFGSSAKAGKMLRKAVHALLQNVKDNRVVSRLQRTMSDIKNLDATSARGLRNVGVAIALPAAKALLKNFNFNKDAALESILVVPYSINTATGIINLNGLIPANDVKPPDGATHFTLRGAWLKLDFATGVYDLQLSNAVNLPLNNVSANVVLTPAAVPSGNGTDIYLLQIEFYQMVNNVQYSLKNNANNALSIIEIA